MVAIKVTIDAKKVKQAIKQWDKELGLASTRIPRKTAQVAKRNYILRTAWFNWKQDPLGPLSSKVKLITNKQRKTASVRINAPHAALIEVGMGRHPVSLREPRNANQERLWQWIQTNERVLPIVKEYAERKKVLWVGKGNRGAFSSRVTQGGGPLEKAFRKAGVSVDRQLKELADRLK